MDDKRVFYASFPVNSEDYNNVVQVWNMGIDSRLEAFTEANSDYKCFMSGRLYIDIFTNNALQILIRRLLELETESAELLADDIVRVQFDIEII